MVKTDIKKHHFFGLDLLRVFAIFFVLLAHGKFILNPIAADNEFMRFLGFWGVELFFVLSGFLIGGILLQIYERENHLQFQLIKSFWKRRWFRTLPNYYFILFVNLVIACFSGRYPLSDPAYYSYFLFVQNLISSPNDFYAESWSLAVEEWFYLLFPIILWAIHLIFKKHLSKKMRFLSVIFILLLMSIILKIAISLFLDFHWSAIKKIVLLRLDSILMGVLFAWFYFYYSVYFYAYRFLFFIIGIILLILSITNYYVDHLFDSSSNCSFFSQTFYFNITSLGFALVIPLSLQLKSSNSLWHRSIQKLSLISYSMYLVHYSIIIPFIKLWSLPSNTFFMWIIYLSYYTSVILLSLILYRFYEKPLTDLRDFQTDTKGWRKVFSYFKRAKILVAASFKRTK